jgi:CelD/BcsL family acetyltransferase involved in cellulose biosynthesis
MATTVAEQHVAVPLRIARTSSDLAAVRDAWASVAWPRVDADLDFLAALLEADPEAVRPHVAALEGSDGRRSLLVGRIDEAELESRIGYRAILRPRVRRLTVGHGGLAGDADALVGEVLRALRAGEADVALLPSLRVDSELYRAARSRPPARSRDRVVDVRTHRRLALPSSFDEFLSGRSKSTRQSIKRYKNKVERELGDRLEFRFFSKDDEADELFAAVDPIAAKTYQSGLGVALRDDERNRRLVSLGLERGWFRAWVLYLDGAPAAFWPGWLYNRTFFSSTPGYEPSLAEYRPGQYVLMRVIADLCADPDVDACDFGFGDSEYKRRFGSEEWDEADVLIFAPSFRGLRLNVGRTAVALADRGIRNVVARAGVEERIKRAWRRRLAGDPASG